MQTILTTPRVLIRQFAEGEDELIIDMNSDERIARFITRRTPEETRTLFKQMLTDYQTEPKLGRWAIIDKQSNEFIGLCMLLAARQGLTGLELGYSLIHKYWGIGIATEAVNALMDYAADNGLTNICAITNLENTASQKVLLKAGFKSNGTVLINNDELLLYKINEGS